jgi:hypothetical protein
MDQDASGWHDETVDTDLGAHASLALDGAGNPHISYCAVGNGLELRHVSHDDTGWHIETVDGAMGECASTSLALDGDGRAHIAYYDRDLYLLEYAYKDADGWHTQLVESDLGYEGGGVSIALDEKGYAHISYIDGTSFDVKLAHWDESGLHIEAVEEVYGATTSLALGAGELPYIAYPGWDFDTWSVVAKPAYHDGHGWHIETIDADLGYRTSVSVALDPAGWTHVSYYDDANGNLMYAC